MTTRTILAGTYTDTGSKGIYAFDLTGGVMSNPRVFAEIDSPKYISVQNTFPIFFNDALYLCTALLCVIVFISVYCNVSCYSGKKAL